MSTGITGPTKGIIKLFQEGRGWDKILSNVATATNGSRAWPTDKRLDEKVGARLDWGETFIKDGIKYRSLKYQPNKGAENPTMKQLAAANSHQVLCNLHVRADGQETRTDNEFGGDWLEETRKRG